MFQLEGQRMAGYCLLQHGKREEARTQLLEAIRIAKPLSTQDRKATTLPQALWDLLQLQDLRRAEKIQLTAPAYLEQTTALHAQAEEAAAKLGPTPTRVQLDVIDAQLHAGLEQTFHRTQQERERLVQGGDEFFRKIVAVGREFLDPHWNGLPTIEHPLDHEIPVWSEPPAMQPLPDPGPLLAGTDLAHVAPPAATPGVVAA